MSLISTFVDAFKKAAGKKPAKPDIDFKTYGPLGSTTQEGGKSFTPLRPTPEADSGQGIDSDDVSVASADPEEGGESDPGQELKRVRRDSPVDEERRQPFSLAELRLDSSTPIWVRLDTYCSLPDADPPRRRVQGRSTEELVSPVSKAYAYPAPPSKPPGLREQRFRREAGAPDPSA